MQQPKKVFAVMSRSGKVRSLHRGADAASKNCPICYRTVPIVGIRVKKGDVRPDILADYEKKFRARHAGYFNAGK